MININKKNYCIWNYWNTIGVSEIGESGYDAKETTYNHNLPWWGFKIYELPKAENKLNLKLWEGTLYKIDKYGYFQIVEFVPYFIHTHRLILKNDVNKLYNIKNENDKKILIDILKNIVWKIKKKNIFKLFFYWLIKKKPFNLIFKLNNENEELNKKKDLNYFNKINPDWKKWKIERMQILNKNINNINFDDLKNIIQKRLLYAWYYYNFIYTKKYANI